MKSVKKSKVRIYVKPGGLKGYRIHDTAKSRRSILKKLLRKNSYSSIIKRLNVLSVYNKNRHPEISKKVKSDISFIQNSSLSPKKRSLKKSKKSSLKKSKKSSLKKLKSPKKRSLKKLKKMSLKKGGKNYSCRKDIGCGRMGCGRMGCGRMGCYRKMSF